MKKVFSDLKRFRFWMRAIGSIGIVGFMGVAIASAAGRMWPADISIGHATEAVVFGLLLWVKGTGAEHCGVPRRFACGQLSLSSRDAYR